MIGLVEDLARGSLGSKKEVPKVSVRLVVVLVIQKERVKGSTRWERCWVESLGSMMESRR